MTVVGREGVGFVVCRAMTPGPLQICPGNNVCHCHVFFTCYFNQVQRVDISDSFHQAHGSYLWLVDNDRLRRHIHVVIHALQTW